MSPIEISLIVFITSRDLNVIEDNKNPTKSPINNKTFSPILATDFSREKKYENVNKNIENDRKQKKKKTI